MMSFVAGVVEKMPITHRMLRIIREISEYRGKAELFKAQSPQVLETLRQVAMIQSTESSNRIEGVEAPLERIKALVTRKATPRNRSEQEIAGYREVLNTIHASALEILNDGDVYFDLGNATGHNVSDNATYYLSDNATGYLSISANLMPKGNRCLKIRAVGDNDTLVSPWVQWCYTRESFDGNFTGDENTTDVPYSRQHYNADAGNWDVIEGGHSVGLQLGAH